jgi:hypothetical protein
MIWAAISHYVYGVESDIAVSALFGMEGKQVTQPFYMFLFWYNDCTCVFFMQLTLAVNYLCVVQFSMLIYNYTSVVSLTRGPSILCYVFGRFGA